MAVLLLVASGCFARVPEGSIQVRAGKKVVIAELAATPEQREKGLMYRQQLKAGHGMLFVFPREAFRSFWMKDTYIPLSIAFLGADKVILNIERMQPRDVKSRHESRGRAKYALEVPQGFFRQHGIKAGQRLEFELPAGTRVH